MAEVRFGPLVVQDHAQYGYLAVPTLFGSFPPVVEFPNFLGVAFVDILHPEAEAEAEHEAEVKKITKKLSCHVHQMENGNHNKTKGKGTNIYFQQARESENIVTHRARVSNSRRSVLIGDMRIHLQSKRAKAVPERVTPTVPIKNSFQALTDKREMYNTFRGKLPPRPVKFKQVWRPKKMQKPRMEEAVLREKAPKETTVVEVPSYQRPPRGFKARTPVRVATGQDQNATGLCEERDGEVRSGSKVATERFVAFRTRRGWLSRQDLERGLSGRRVHRVCA
ncbi:hypothetical protein Taro_042347 [Colocasia esculenta]|uniref:Uncharacterized protein n=1 Tax=Colocasia esculenta TaxID=4460 RepID=A0A843WGL1_COLES|nr:hypothetical protein [Colocasia esculenta]